MRRLIPEYVIVNITKRERHSFTLPEQRGCVKTLCGLYKPKPLVGSSISVGCLGRSLLNL
jgi:hypothetical protein